jgi:hypothetical protein
MSAIGIVDEQSAISSQHSAEGGSNELSKVVDFEAPTTKEFCASGLTAEC